MSETPIRPFMYELKRAIANGVLIDQFHLETSRTAGVIGYIRATVTARKDDSVTPRTVQFSSHELALPIGQDEKFYPEPIQRILEMIRKTSAAIQ